MIGLGPSYHTVESRCPLCGHKLDGASAVDDDDRPKEGDIGVCISCATVLQYSADLQVKVCPDRVWRRFEPELVARVERTRAAVLQLDRRGMNNGSL
jgi:predicted RNA-binding Zn-ribbon protein involved in translation (DUF1610 family)